MVSQRESPGGHSTLGFGSKEEEGETISERLPNKVDPKLLSLEEEESVFRVVVDRRSWMVVDGDDEEEEEQDEVANTERDGKLPICMWVMGAWRWRG